MNNKRYGIITFTEGTYNRMTMVRFPPMLILDVKYEPWRRCVLVTAECSIFPLISEAQVIPEYKVTFDDEKLISIEEVKQGVR